MPGFGSVRPTREMQFLQAERDKEAADTAAQAPGSFTAPGVAGREGTDAGPSRFADVLRAREAYRQKFPAMRAAAPALAARMTPGQAGVHEATSENNEAGFFQPGEFAHSDAPAMNYAPPGYLEAGHRRPEDQDPLAEAAYQQDYNLQQIGRPRRMA
jgi:hypothetical protein